MSTGKALVWSNGKRTVRRTSDPENDLDGDAFWIWTDGIDVMMSFETYTGQAAEAAATFISKYPKLAEVSISEESPSNAGDTLAQVVLDVAPREQPPAQVGTWYHGTSSSKLDFIFESGLVARLDHEERCWPGVEDPEPGVVYLALHFETSVSYAERCAKLHGGAPVILAIDASALASGHFVEDRDFRHSTEWQMIRSGDWLGVEPSAASLAYDGTGRVARDCPSGCDSQRVFKDARREMGRPGSTTERSVPDLNPF